MTDRGEIKSLTGLRGVAACFVVVYHYFQMPLGPGIINHFLMHGYLAVDLFFVLSGFVIAMIYGPRFAENPTLTRYRDFLIRRIGRIYPLYLAITLMIIVIKLSRADPADTPNVPTLIANLLLVQSWGFADSINGTAWSISTELGAYLLFPIIATVLLRGTTTRVYIAMIFFTAVLLIIGAMSSASLNQIHGVREWRNGPLDINGSGTIFPMARCLASFCLGVLTFRLGKLLFGNNPIAAKKFGRAADLLAAISLVVLAIPGSDVAFVLIMVPFILALAISDISFTAKILSSRLVYGLGVISYSIYLVHRLVEEYLLYPAFYYIKDAGILHAFSFARAGAIVVVLIVSTITYYVIEKPGRDGIRALMRSRRAALA